jgi:hypothetical protein
VSQKNFPSSLLVPEKKIFELELELKAELNQKFFRVDEIFWLDDSTKGGQAPCAIIHR